MTQGEKVGLVTAIAAAMRHPTPASTEAATEALRLASEEDYDRAMFAIRRTYPAKAALIDEWDRQLRRARAATRQ